MNEEILAALQELNVVIAEIKTERDMLRKENEYLRALVQHLASRPAPQMPPPNQPDPYGPPYKVTC
jgi:uncharacterized coiled-coil protein SlyX